MRAAEFDLQPCPKGERALIRPLRPSNSDDLFARASDLLIRALRPIRNRHEHPGFTKVFGGSLARKGAVVVMDKGAARRFGLSRDKGADPAANRAEIGWCWRALAHRGGLWHRAVKPVLPAHAFRFGNPEVVRVGLDNTCARRAMEQIGGRLTDRTEPIHGQDGALITRAVFPMSSAGCAA